MIGQLEGIVELKEHQSRDEDDGRSQQRPGRKVFSQNAEGQRHPEERHQVKGRRRDDYVDGDERFEKKYHRHAIEKDRKVAKGSPLLCMQGEQDC